jgi:hypothetical protein
LKKEVLLNRGDRKFRGVRPLSKSIKALRLCVIACACETGWQDSLTSSTYTYKILFEYLQVKTVNNTL